ncbi:hypothetical protein LY78DRAFT_349770 [Colletotrichum sublineola]|nr:hypothetical protein LY78DRAFT_349770 [Colletotrichum sublineola]
MTTRLVVVMKRIVIKMQLRLSHHLIPIVPIDLVLYQVEFMTVHHLVKSLLAYSNNALDPERLALKSQTT